MHTDTISRRTFIVTGGLGLASIAGAPALRLASRRTADVVIRRSIVFDGLGHAGVEAYVPIANGRVIAIGRNLAAKGKREIDARGLAVAPGFVDIPPHR